MEIDSARKISTRSAVFNYIGKAIMTVFDIAIFILVTKKLLIEDYGVYSFLIATLSFFAFFASLGIPYALLRFIPEYMANNKKDIAICMIRLSLYVICAFGILLVIFSFVAADKMSVIFKIESLKRLFPLLIAIGTLYIIMRVEEEVLNALFMQVFRNICKVFASLVKLISFFLILRYSLGIDWLLFAIAAVSILQAFIYFIKIYKYFPKKIDKDSKIIPSKLELKRFSLFSAKEYLFVITAFFWDMSLDIYIITYLLGPLSAGIFTFAYSISFFLFHWSPGIVLQSIMSPLFVSEYAKHNNGRSVKNLFKFYNKFKVFFAFPVIIGVWLLAGKFELIFYHNKFAPAIDTLKILVLFVMLQAFTIPIRDIFNIFEKNEFSLYCNIVIVYRICASILFIKHFGIIGAAYAYGTSMLIYFFMHLVLVKRIIKIEYPVKSFLKILVNSLVMGLFLMTIRRFMPDTLAWLLIAGISGILIYLIASYVNKPFEKEERGYIREALSLVRI